MIVMVLDNRSNKIAQPQNTVPAESAGPDAEMEHVSLPMEKIAQIVHPNVLAQQDIPALQEPVSLTLSAAMAYVHPARIPTHVRLIAEL